MAEKALQGYPDVLESLTLVPSTGGIFEVTLGDNLIFSKRQEDRFPEEEDILPKVEALRGDRL